MGLWALGECKLEDPEASHCRWQDLVSLFLIRELRVVWLSRICLLGRRVFAVNWGRANTPPRAGTGCKFLSPELSGSRPHICGCPTPQHAHSLQDEVLSFSLAPLYSFIHSFTDLSIQSSICSFIHPSTHPPIHPFIHLSIHPIYQYINWALSGWNKCINHGLQYSVKMEENIKHFGNTMCNLNTFFKNSKWKVYT